MNNDLINRLQQYRSRLSEEAGRLFEGQFPEARQQNLSSHTASSILTLDSASAENNAAKSQEQWIAYWNSISDGRRFASMADYYQVFKQLTDARQNGSPAEKASAKESIASLRKDFRENYLFTSTRIIYQPNSLEARLIHGYGANNLQLTSERVLSVPLYGGTLIASAYAASEGLTYLQALLNTEDSGQAIAERLSIVSGYQPQDIKVWTPSLQSSQWLTRSQLSERAVELYSSSGGFHLYANRHPVDYHNRSRGVR